MQTPRLTRSSILALSLGLLGLAAPRASAQTVINSVPIVITESGHYVLAGNLTNNNVSTPAIWIKAPNVTIDLNGYYVAGAGNPAVGGSNLGYSVIYVENVANVTVKNGTVAGVNYGIVYLMGNAVTSRNYVVDHVTVTRCYERGILAYGFAPGSAIRNCSFSTIGNSTSAANISATAITTHGGFVIKGNNIGDVTATGTGDSYGLSVGASDFVIGNTIANCKYGVSGGKYLNNLTYNVTTPFSSGTAANGNN